MPKKFSPSRDGERSSFAWMATMIALVHSDARTLVDSRTPNARRDRVRAHAAIADAVVEELAERLETEEEYDARRRAERGGPNA